jgi:hypothetical protein
MQQRSHFGGKRTAFVVEISFALCDGFVMGRRSGEVDGKKGFGDSHIIFAGDEHANITHE